MRQGTRYFWLGLASHWIRIVAVIGTLLVALPGLQRIDSVMISGSDDWSAHAAALAAGLAYLAAAALTLAAGLALSDLITLLLSWEAQRQQRDEPSPRLRAQPVLPPLPTSQALLESLGIATPKRVAVPSASRGDARVALR
jgi:hypothetical protein